MKLINLLSIIAFSVLSYAQINPVIDYQKINELEGGFTYTLNQDDYFGVAVDSIGDLNNDGIVDIIVGAHKDDDGGTDRGAVYILFLNSDGSVNHSQKISDTEGNFLGVLDDGDVFGSSVSSLGDLNGDGITDIAVGAQYDNDAGYWRGAFYILFLDTNGLVQSYNKINETDLGVTLSGTPVFGSDITSIGDLNGDGITDLAVGSRRDNDGGSIRGAVWILFMNTDGTVQSSQKISDTQGGLTHPLNFEDQFGSSVAYLGDLNNDGNSDIAVSAHRDDDGGTDKGAIYILFLNSDGTVNHEQKISSTEGNFTGSLNSDKLFGVSVASIGDINWDYKTDIIVGAPGDNTNGNASGSFYILNLDTNGTVISYQFVTEGTNNFSGNLDANDWFGRSVASIGKIGMNHRLLIGAWSDSDNNNIEKGAVWILSIKGEINTQMPTINKNDLNLYPNPVNDLLFIDYNKLSSGQNIIIYNSLGHTISGEVNYLDHKAYINTQNLSKGVYILRLGNITKKFIKL